MWFKSICLFAFLLSLSGYAYSQKRLISEAELSTVINKALEARRLVPYRIRKSMVIFQSGVEIETVTEHSPPGRARTVLTTRDGKKLSRTETIWIDKLRYERVDDGRWSVRKRRT